MEVGLEETAGIRLAIEGCGHGTLHAIYASVEQACKQKGWSGVDLLIIGGDFQSVRNAFDLNCVSMPPKYREMCDFHEYYSGQRSAPCLTVFVGGNHEASNFLFELYYGGWVAPNIYYMGAANVLRLGPLRIAGMSGIWKGFDYRKPHFERLPYNELDLRSVYHTRELDVRKLLQIRTQVDIGVSHDWPQGVEWKGDWRRLFNVKKHFQDDARTGKLGSVAAKQVMERLRPKYWFSAHLHCKYAAVVSHADESADQKASSGAHGSSNIAKDVNGAKTDDNGTVQSPALAIARNEDEIDLDLDDEPDPPDAGALDLNTTPAAATSTASINADEIDLEMDDDEPVSTTQPHPEGSGDALTEARAALPDSFARPKAPEHMEHPPEITNLETNFLALDKCLPNRGFLQLTSVPTANSHEIDQARPLKLEYDPEWLAITRAFALSESPVFGTPDARVPLAKAQSVYRTLISEQQEWLERNLSRSDLVIPQNFEVTAPVYDGGHFQDSRYQRVEEFPNPQTTRFCELLQMPNPLAISDNELRDRLAAGPRPEAERFDGGGRGGFRRGRGRGGFGGRADWGRGRGGRGRGRGRGH